MRAAILCPGPSLASTWPIVGYSDTAFGQVIAVNRALVRHPKADWLVSADWPMIKSLGLDTPTVDGRPVKVCTQDRCAEILRAKGRDALGFGALMGGHFCYSTLAAFALAEHLGASDVYVFGDDKYGELDFDGAAAGMNRTEGRWAIELRQQDEIMQRMRLKTSFVFVSSPAPGQISYRSPNLGRLIP